MYQLFYELFCPHSYPSGVTCGILAMAAYMCGKDDVAVYDGAWTEWYKRASHKQKESVPL